VYRKALESPVHTEKSAQLLETCQFIHSLREAMSRTAGDKRSASDAWKSVKQLLEEILEIKKVTPDHAGWAICKDEVILVAKEANIHEVRSRLEQSLKQVIIIPFYLFIFV
jgi:hypothetical protein